MSVIRGWCPGALRPMESGDGWVVRVRPRLARLTRDQALGLCRAAGHGAGLIDLTNRANVQLRGVPADRLDALRADLAALDLLDTDPVTEGRRNIVTAPLWVAGDDTQRIAAELAARLGELPDLPPKMGVAVDAGPGPVLGAVPADFRIERGAGRGLILRADGHARGLALAPGAEVDALIELARWFVDTGGAQSGRMARHRAALPWMTHAAPAAPHPVLRPGAHPLGAVHGLAFGQVRAADLVAAIHDSGAQALRVTPWRVLVLEGGAFAPRPGLIHDPADPLLSVDACAGAPLCPQATVATRDLAVRLAGRVAGHLHVSGCAKGCARPGPADLVLTGRDGRFDLARNARAGDTPERAGLTPSDLTALLKV